MTKERLILVREELRAAWDALQGDGRLEDDMYEDGLAVIEVGCERMQTE